MDSVDLSRVYYRDPTKETGFVADQFKDAHPDIHARHRKFLGETAAACLGRICEEGNGKIDFLILDTVHVLPGEVLDFITALPFLEEGAIVAMHDVGNNHIPGHFNFAAFATRVLFDTVTAGEKI